MLFGTIPLLCCPSETLSALWPYFFRRNHPPTHGCGPLRPPGPTACQSCQITNKNETVFKSETGWTFFRFSQVCKTSSYLILGIAYALFQGRLKLAAAKTENRKSQTMVSKATAHLLLTLLAGIIQHYGYTLPPSVEECIQHLCFI